MNEETEVYHGSGNVFADLGLPDAEERLAGAAPFQFAYVSLSRLIRFF